MSKSSMSQSNESRRLLFIGGDAPQLLRRAKGPLSAKQRCLKRGRMKTMVVVCLCFAVIHSLLSMGFTSGAIHDDSLHAGFSFCFLVISFTYALLSLYLLGDWPRSCLGCDIGGSCFFARAAEVVPSVAALTFSLFEGFHGRLSGVMLLAFGIAVYVGSSMKKFLVACDDSVVADDADGVPASGMVAPAVEGVVAGPFELSGRLVSSGLSDSSNSSVL